MRCQVLDVPLLLISESVWREESSDIVPLSTVLGRAQAG
jgi:hypothetical protein